MALSASELRWNEEYRKTNDLIARLNADQLRAIQSVAREFAKAASEEDFYTPMTREAMLADIDLSLSEADRGTCRTIDHVGAELASKYGFEP